MNMDRDSLMNDSNNGADKTSIETGNYVEEQQNEDGLTLTIEEIRDLIREMKLGY